jgi:XTP/dITP diphosphohydrolase
MKILIGTYNKNKYTEFSRLMHAAGIETVNLNELQIFNQYQENAVSFLDNAIGKAIYYSQYTDLITIADDSGLVIPALDGFPGIKSSRYGKESMTQSEKNKSIIEKMRGLKTNEKVAYFVCALAAAINQKIIYVTEERVRGIIADDEKGTGGFGYDPIFLYVDAGKTFAEMQPSEKDLYSHRGKAARNLIDYLSLLNKELSK